MSVSSSGSAQAGRHGSTVTVVAARRDQMQMPKAQVPHRPRDRADIQAFAGFDEDDVEMIARRECHKPYGSAARRRYSCLSSLLAV